MLYYDTDLEFSSAVLLSDYEAKKYLWDNERVYPTDWWLRSPGPYSDFSRFVSLTGYISKNGGYVYNNFCVRPALYIIHIGSYRKDNIFTIGEWEFKIISPHLAWLHKQDIGKTAFGKTNDFNTSEAKKLIDSWYESLKKEMA